MRTATENTQEILTSPQARKIIDYISPIYNDGPIALSILNAIGTELDDLEEWAQQLWREINPLTATWSMKYWELNYGLPINTGMSLDQRRGRLLAKINARAPMNPFRLESMVKNVCQREAEVVENTGYRKFDVNIQPGTNDFNYSDVLDAVKKAKPSRLYFDLFVVVRESLTNGLKLINYVYNHPICNQFDCGELPMAGTVGEILTNNISLLISEIKAAYDIEACGTFPNIGTVGVIINQLMIIDNNTISGLSNENPCGAFPLPGTVGLTISNPLGAACIETHAVNQHAACGALISLGSQGLAAVMDAMALSLIRTTNPVNYALCGDLTCGA